MKNSLPLIAVALLWAFAPASNGDGGKPAAPPTKETKPDPFGPDAPGLKYTEEGETPGDGKLMKLTEAAKKTLRILETEKFDLITIEPDDRHQAYQLLKERLEKHGIEMRFLSSGPIDSKYAPRGPLALRNVPFQRFMKYLDHWAEWGWILYEDGSITYFDRLCACSHPKDGIYFHESQYKEGHPETLKKAAKEAETPEP